MAAIGSISLSVNGAIDAGLALLLVNPPKSAHEFHHGGAIFRVSQDTSFIVCCFSGAKSCVEALSLGSNLIQEGLDLLSMTGRADLATRDANEEYVVWWTDDGNSTITYASTVTFTVSVGPVELTVCDAAGNIVPQKIVVPQHHLGFRFFRLAQVSDDLFDAYRNMYLAFELFLVNDESSQMSCSPDTTFDLNGFHQFEVFFFMRGNNASQPKYLYAR